MAVRLCRCGVGESSPTRLLKQLTAADIALYQAEHKRRPFGDDITHWLMAYLAATFLNAKRSETQIPIKATDLLPWYIPPEQTADEIFAQLRSAKRGSSSDH